LSEGYGPYRLRKNPVFSEGEKGKGFSPYINPAISTGLNRLRKNSESGVTF
jgi:hypothetical protein